MLKRLVADLSLEKQILKDVVPLLLHYDHGDSDRIWHLNRIGCPSDAGEPADERDG